MAGSTPWCRLFTLSASLKSKVPVLEPRFLSIAWFWVDGSRSRTSAITAGLCRWSDWLEGRCPWLGEAEASLLFTVGVGSVELVLRALFFLVCGLSKKPLSSGLDLPMSPARQIHNQVWHGLWCQSEFSRHNHTVPLKLVRRLEFLWSAWVFRSHNFKQVAALMNPSILCRMTADTTFQTFSTLVIWFVYWWRLVPTLVTKKCSQIVGWCAKGQIVGVCAWITRSKSRGSVVTYG